MKPDMAYIQPDTLSYRRIEELELIPGFSYLSAPDFRWFESGPLAHSGLVGENWHDWSMVKMSSEAVEAATALGLPVVMVSWESPWHARHAQPGAQGAKEVRFDFTKYDALSREPVLDAFMANAVSQGLDPVEVEPNVWAVYVSPATFIGLVTPRQAIFELARYFTLASRAQFRNPAYDYGALPPGNGWGEYQLDVFQRGTPETWWLVPSDVGDSRYIQALREDFIPQGKATEIKAADSGSIVDGTIQHDRDAEWIGRGPARTSPETPGVVQGAGGYETPVETALRFLGIIRALGKPRLFRRAQKLVGQIEHAVAAQAAIYERFGPYALSAQTRAAARARGDLDKLRNVIQTATAKLRSMAMDYAPTTGTTGSRAADYHQLHSGLVAPAPRTLGEHELRRLLRPVGWPVPQDFPANDELVRQLCHRLPLDELFVCAWKAVEMVLPIIASYMPPHPRVRESVWSILQRYDWLRDRSVDSRLLNLMRSYSNHAEWHARYAASDANRAEVVTPQDTTYIQLSAVAWAAHAARYYVEACSDEPSGTRFTGFPGKEGGLLAAIEGRQRWRLFEAIILAASAAAGEPYLRYAGEWIENQVRSAKVAFYELWWQRCEAALAFVRRDRPQRLWSEFGR